MSSCAITRVQERANPMFMGTTSRRMRLKLYSIGLWKIGQERTVPESLWDRLRKEWSDVL